MKNDKLFVIMKVDLVSETNASMPLVAFKSKDEAEKQVVEFEKERNEYEFEQIKFYTKKIKIMKSVTQWRK